MEWLLNALTGDARPEDGAIHIGLLDTEVQTDEAFFYSELYPDIPDTVLAQLNQGIQPASNGLRFEDRKDLLKPGYLTMENGVCVLEDGSHLTCVKTDMPGVSGEMLDWWFWWHLVKSVRYKLWHPKEHARNGCKHPERLRDPSLTDREKYLTVHYPVERLNDTVLHPIALQFVAPEEFGFTVEEMQAANAPTIVCVILMSPNENVIIGRMIHFVRDREYDDGRAGVELRSRFG